MAIREINLTPPETAGRRHIRRHLFFWGGCAAAIVAFLGILFVFHSLHISGQKKTMAAFSDAPVVLQSRLAEIRNAQSEIDLLDKRRAVLASLSETSRPTSTVVGKISTMMNGATWLSSFVFEKARGKEPELVKLTGYSLSNQDIGDFLSRLSADPGIRNVELKYAVENKVSGAGQKTGGRTLVQFQIECRLGKKNG